MPPSPAGVRGADVELHGLKQIPSSKALLGLGSNKWCKALQTLPGPSPHQGDEIGVLCRREGRARGASGMRRREQPGAAAPEESRAHAGKVLAANEAGREQSGALTQK